MSRKKSRGYFETKLHANYRGTLVQKSKDSSWRSERNTLAPSRNERELALQLLYPAKVSSGQQSKIATFPKKRNKRSLL